MPELTGAEVIAQMLEAYGVTHVFFVPTILTHSLVEMEKSTDIARVLVHSEKAGAYMADGYARVSGRPGVCLAQMVGAANLASGLRDARLTSSPLIAITGGPFKHSRDRFQYQEIEDRPMFAPLVKSSTRVELADRLPAVLRQAFRTATSGRPGPVHVEFESHHGDSVELQTTEEEPLTDNRNRQVPPFRPPADIGDVAEAARLLSRAERPVIVAGGGVRMSGARQQLVEFADAFGIPVAASLSGKDVIPSDHPLSAGVIGLYSRECANRIVGGADLVFFVGTKTGSQGTHNWKVPDPSKRIIHCDIDPEVVGVNYLNSSSLVGDVSATLRQLTEAMNELKQVDRAPWIASVRSTVTDWYAANEAVRNSQATPIRPERLCKDLSLELPEDAVVVADTGHAGMWCGGWLDLRSPEQIFVRAAGSLGWALPASIGAQCALPDRPVVTFTGDGGIWYHLSELETAARWNIPVKVIVNNNNSLNQEIPIYQDAYGGELRGKHEQLWHFREVNFASIAREFGIASARVESADGFSVAFKEALRTDGPFLIDVATDMFATAPFAFLPQEAGP
ncbi:MAG: thiamine pyrophosphate-binding protein [Actinomycetota bacterium]